MIFIQNKCIYFFYPNQTVRIWEIPFKNALLRFLMKQTPLTLHLPPHHSPRCPQRLRSIERAIRLQYEWIWFPYSQHTTSKIQESVTMERVTRKFFFCLCLKLILHYSAMKTRWSFEGDNERWLVSEQTLRLWLIMRANRKWNWMMNLFAQMCICGC